MYLNPLQILLGFGQVDVDVLQSELSTVRLGGVFPLTEHHCK